MSHWPTHCERCGADLSKVSSIMSKFNQDTICSDCKARERAHPGYKAADEAEVASVRAGEHNFPGVGCPPVLHQPACLAEEVVIALEGKLPILSVKIAQDHGGEFISDPVLDTDQFRFPDGSELTVKRTSPVRCTVLAYPNT